MPIPEIVFAIKRMARFSNDTLKFSVSQKNVNIFTNFISFYLLILLSNKFHMEKQAALQAKSSTINTGYSDYELAAFPGQLALNDVLEEKLQFKENYGEKFSTESNARITIAQFRANEEMEETLIRYMHRIFFRQQGFDVDLNNYSSIPPHTIYLRVQNHLPFKKLISEMHVLNHYLNSGIKQTLSFPAVPRINIASNLPEPVYEKAIAAYSKKTFHQSFTVSELILFRSNPPYHSYQIVNIFKLL